MSTAVNGDRFIVAMGIAMLAGRPLVGGKKVAGDPAGFFEYEGVSIKIPILPAYLNDFERYTGE